MSATDHATACGVPRLDGSGLTVLGPGLRRPLILTTLELDEAMRILGTPRRHSLLAAASLLLAAPVVVAGGLLVTLTGGGTPDLASSPLGVLAGVVGLGLVTAVVTAALARWGRRPGR